MGGSGNSSSDEDHNSKVDPNHVFTQMEVPVIIIGEKYCSKDPMQLVFEKCHSGEEKFRVSDADGNILFRAKKKKSGRRIMSDASDEPVLSFTTKHITMHRRRVAFKGDSSDHHDMIFSFKKKLGLRSLKFDVYLRSNVTESTFNFRIHDNYRDGTSTIYAADKSTVIAQLHTPVSHHKAVKSEEKYTVSVGPNVDRAFIAALAMIREEVRKLRHKGYES